MNVGQETAPRIIDALTSAGYAAVNYVLDEVPNRDANDWLVRDRAGLAARLQELEQIAESELESIAQELKYRAKSATNSVAEEENPGDDTLAFIKSTAARNEFVKLRSQPDSPARNAAMTRILRDNLDWRKTPTGEKTCVRPTSKNYRRVFYCDPVLAGLVGHDEFLQQTVFLRQAPWRKRKCIGEPWTDDDDARLRIFLRENYGELAHAELTSDFFRAAAMDNSFNSVVRWLEQLPAWDGTPRAESIFIDFLRADDSPYVREATMNWLLGAVARVYYPGCNYHYCLVLQGQQGCGKSYLLEQLGGQWHADLKDRLDNEKAVDALQLAWICELGELSATRRVDVNSLKCFLSESYDTHRFPYERRAVRRPRHVVFAGTCNDKTPLNDPTGARRFNVIQCHNKRGQFVPGFSREYVQQIWSEVRHKFRQLFPTDDAFDANKLLLSPESAKIAAQLAEGATMDDGLEAEIAAFLDKPIPAPAIWRLLTKCERGRFFAEAAITISADTLRARQKARRRPQELRELEAALEDMTPTEIKNFRGETTGIGYTLYGDTYRQHICAAEIVSEMSSRPDRRLTMRRVNEALNSLDGWEKGDRIQGDPQYGDQRNIFRRVTPLEFDDNNTGGGNTGGNTGGNVLVTEEDEFDGYDPNHDTYSGTDYEGEEAVLLQCKYYRWLTKQRANTSDAEYYFRKFEHYRSKLESLRNCG